MKKITFFLMLFILDSVNAQIPQLKLTKSGVEPIVINVDSLTHEQIYKSSINWINETYINPKEVLAVNVENQKVRINGFAKNAWWIKMLGSKTYYDMEYYVEIEFKDGRYKLTYSIGSFFLSGGKKVAFDYSTLFKKDGDVVKFYNESVPEIEKTMNNLSLSLYNSIVGKQKNDDDW